MIIALTWGLLGLLLGVCSFVGVPLTLAVLGGVGMRDKVGRWYVDQMMTVLSDGALVAREHGGIELCSVSFDPEFSADRISVGGETGHLADDLNVKGRLSGNGFGIGLESHPVYISPLFAEFAERASDAVHNNRIEMTDGGARLDFEISQTPTVPELRGAHRILDGDARRRFGVLAESWAKKSQEKFGTPISVGQTIILILAFCAGAGMGLLVLKYGPSSGATNISLQVGGVLL